MAKHIVPNAVTLLLAAPQEHFSDRAKDMIRSWSEATSSQEIQKVLDTVKRHNQGSMRARHLLTSLLLDAQLRENVDESNAT